MRAIKRGQPARSRTSVRESRETRHMGHAERTGSGKGGGGEYDDSLNAAGSNSPNE